MKNTTKLAPHETLELHEILNNEITSVKKLQVSIPMIEDSDLKSFAENCLNTKIMQIETMQQLIANQNNQK